MDKIYKKEPDNFRDIEDFIIIEDNEVLNVFLMFKEIYFYDTCSLQCHSKSNSKNKIADYIKNNNGAIVITQTVLTELGGHNGKIECSVIDYLRIIKEKDISIILFKEEKLLDILRKCTEQSYLDCNKDLAYAIGEVSRNKGAVDSIERKLGIKRNILSKNSQDKTLFGKFFNYALSKKVSGDDLGEEMMFICFIVLSKIPVIEKLVFLSNDIKSRCPMSSLIKYTKYRYEKQPYQLTSSTLFYKLVKDGMIETKEQLRELIEKSSKDNNMNIYYTDKYSIDIEHTSLTIDEYVEKVFHEVEFKVIY